MSADSSSAERFALNVVAPSSTVKSVPSKETPVMSSSVNVCNSSIASCTLVAAKPELLLLYKLEAA